MKKNLKEIKKDLLESLEMHKAQKEAWENVKRVTKKDGSDFATLSKIFENATIKNVEYSLREDKEIRVNGRTESGKFIDDYFSISPLVKDAKFDIAEERQIKEPCLCAYFHMNADEIEKAIADRVKLHEQYIESYEEQLKIADDVYLLIEKELDKIHLILNDLCIKGNDKNLSLRYALEENVRSHYFR